MSGTEGYHAQAYWVMAPKVLVSWVLKLYAWQLRPRRREALSSGLSGPQFHDSYLVYLVIISIFVFNNA